MLSTRLRPYKRRYQIWLRKKREAFRSTYWQVLGALITWTVVIEVFFYYA